MKKIVSFIISCALILQGMPLFAFASSIPESEPIVRAAKTLPFTKGTNLNSSIASTPEIKKVLHEIDEASKLGMDVFRIPINMVRMIDTSTYELPQEFFDEFKFVFDYCETNYPGMYFILDNHSFENDVISVFGNDVTEAKYTQVLNTIWRQITTEFNGKYPNVIYELQNEAFMFISVFKDYKKIQADLVKQIRTIDKQHYILYAYFYPQEGDEFYTKKYLENNKMILNLHYYKPMKFTHQGADWINPPYTQLGVPFPNDEYSEKNMVEDINEEIRRANAFGTPIIISEFGTIRKAESSFRHNWYSAFGRIVAESGASWTNWNQGFELYCDDETTPYCSDILDSLGLKYLADEQQNEYILYDDLVRNSQLASVWGLICDPFNEDAYNGSFTISCNTGYGGFRFKNKRIDYQKFINEDYTVSFWAKSKNDAPLKTLRVDFGIEMDTSGKTAALSSSIYIDGDDTWRKYEIPLKDLMPTGEGFDINNAQFFNFFLRDASFHDIKFDDIKLTAEINEVTEEPAAPTAPKATISKNTISPTRAQVRRGGKKVFTAKISGSKNVPATVKWTVSGNKKKGTKISASGVLTIAANETAKTLTVTAASTDDSSKKVKATVKVTKPVTPRLTAKNVPTSKKVKKGRKITLKAPKRTTVYYTKNGKKPTTKSARVKAGKSVRIKITKKTTIKVIAVKKNCLASKVLSRRYQLKRR